MKFLPVSSLSIYALALLSGCSPKTEPAAAPAPSAAVGTTPATTPKPIVGSDSEAGSGAAPRPGGMSGPAADAPLTPTPKFDEAIKAAEAKGDKAELTQSYMKRGLIRMGDSKAGDKARAEGAKSDFAKALEASPNDPRLKKLLDSAEASLKRLKS